MKIRNVIPLALLATFSAGLHAENTETNKKHKAHVSYMKPGAPIRLHQPDGVQIEASQASTVEVGFDTPNSGVLTLTVKPKPGLSLVNNATEWQFDLSQGAPKLPLTLEAAENGKYYVMFHAEIDNNGNRSSRVFGMPVQVGKEAPAAKQKGQGPTHIIMKAQETIRYE